MKIHRFFTAVTIQGGVAHANEALIIHQMQRVLKLSPGEMVAFLDGSGQVWYGPLTDTRDAILIERVAKNENELGVPYMLYAAITKRDTFELVVQKATELGITHIIPIITAHTVKLGIARERLLRIAAEAVELSHRSVVPQIDEPVAFDEAFRLRDTTIEHIVCDTAPNISEHCAPSPHARALWIGPEGGFHVDEREQFVAAECTFLSLGKTILRAETAAIVATYACRPTLPRV